MSENYDLETPFVLQCGRVLIGWSRVSTRAQHATAQVDALTRAGCARVFVDTASGTLATRPQLSRALAPDEAAGAWR